MLIIALNFFDYNQIIKAFLLSTRIIFFLSFPEMFFFSEGEK